MLSYEVAESIRQDRLAAANRWRLVKRARQNRRRPARRKGGLSEPTRS